MTKFAECKTKVSKVAHIKHQLMHNDRWMVCGVVAIYNRQTASEKTSQHTQEHNGVGYSGVDGTFMSSIAEQLIRKQAHIHAKDKSKPFDVREYLSANQLPHVRKRILKYAQQLMRLAEGA